MPVDQQKERAIVLRAAVLSGIVAGFQLRDQLVFVPEWRLMSPSEARERFRRIGPRSAALHAPLIAAAAVASFDAFRQTRSGGSSALRCSAIVASTAPAVVTCVVHVPIGVRILSARTPDDAVATLVRRWVRWHAIRTVAVVVGAGMMTMLRRDTVRRAETPRR